MGTRLQVVRRLVAEAGPQTRQFADSKLGRLCHAEQQRQQKQRDQQRRLGWSPEASIEIGIARVLLAFRHPRKGVASFGIWAVFQPFSGTFWHFRSS